jgi:calcium/calmodulin-dependent protein kinase I
LIEISEIGALANAQSTSLPHTQASNPVKPKSEKSVGGESGVAKEVALKVIAKKKVKGNEANVWGEMEVLKGLNHPNIVCITSILLEC